MQSYVRNFIIVPYVFFITTWLSQRQYLRQNIYNLLDKVIENNIPIEINRKGKKLKIISTEKIDKFKNLKRRNLIIGDPEDLVNISFEKEWKPYI